MIEGVGIGILVAIVGGYIWYIFASMIEDWTLTRFSNREAQRKAAAQPKAIT